MFPDLTRDDVFRLETRSLWLRWPRISDAAAIIRQAGEKAVAEMTANVPHPYPPESAEPAIFAMRKGNATGEHLALAVTLKGRPNDLIGIVSAFPNEAGIPTLGYWLGSAHWNKGYGTQAVQAMVDAVFTLVETPAVEAHARVINPGSRRVLEKSGFRHEGSVLRALEARGGLFPSDQFRLDRSTWAALKNWSQSGWAGQAAQTPSEAASASDEASEWSGAPCPA
ncbi:MAG: GNAT family N-acetyltransferase [Bosea sp. (in: a-proteobacteria)]